MAVFGFTASDMGQRVGAEDPESVFFLQGWRGNEDEDVNVESSDCSSQEIGGLKRLSESASTGVGGLESIQGKDCTLHTVNNVPDLPEISIEETSEARGQECDSEFEVRDSGLGVEKLNQGYAKFSPRKESSLKSRPHNKKPVEQQGTVSSSGESSSMKDLEEPSVQKRPGEGKRLDARRFRYIFAAKLDGAKRLKTGLSSKGKEQGDIRQRLSDCALSSSSLEHSGDMPSITGRLKTATLTDSKDEQDHEHISPPPGMQAAGAKWDSANEAENCKVFSRKRKHANQPVAQTGERGERTTSDQLLNEGNAINANCQDSEGEMTKPSDCSDKISDSLQMQQDGPFGCSKRARKDNVRKDYIPWSAFGRVPIKRSERNKTECLNNSAPTDSNGRVFEIGIENKEPLGNCSISSGEDPQVTIVSYCPEGRVISCVNGVQEEGCSVPNERKIDEVFVDMPAKKKGSENMCETPLERSFRNYDELDESQPSELGRSKFTYQKKKKKVLSNFKSISEVQDRDILQVETIIIENMQENTGATDYTEIAHEEASHHEGNLRVELSSQEPLVYVDQGSGCGTERAQEQTNGSQSNGIPSTKHMDPEGLMFISDFVDLTQIQRKPNVDDNDSSAVEDTNRDGVRSQHLVEETECCEEYSAMDDHDSVCNRCKLEGNLICCDGKGCKITYHIDCLDPPLMDVPPDDWYCPDCSYKRIFSGVHSVSKGVESIWDVKEGTFVENEPRNGSACSLAADELRQLNGKEGFEVAHDEESGDISGGRLKVRASQGGSLAMAEAKDCLKDCRNTGNESDLSTVKLNSAERLFLVKYKGSSHAHNLWLSESQISKEVPKLFNNFKKKLEQGKASPWDPEWAEPCRVIGKRLTMLSKCDSSDCEQEAWHRSGRYLEWCIKWKGLGYESCTWEPADKWPLTTKHAKDLIKDYETRSERARQHAQLGREQNVEGSRAFPFTNLNGQPIWWKGEQIHRDQLNAINNLRKYWLSKRNGIVIDEAHVERIATTIIFLVCLVEEFKVANSVLVIVPPSSLEKWEVAFHKWALNINVVSYAGTREARAIIRRYEFFNEDGHLMPRFVLTSFDTLHMDVEYLKGLRLEALIIDECQRLKGSKTSKSIFQLDSAYRLLLVSEPLKDNADDYQHLLSILENSNDSLAFMDQTAYKNGDVIGKMKSIVRKHMVYEPRNDITGSSHQKEYWVPVGMTAIQVEEYCKLLIDKSDTLTRGKRGDIVSSPHELLLKIRECCNHPYLVNLALHPSKPGLSAKEVLDIGIQASGKLKLLDLMLSEAKSSGKRVVIVTQMHLRSDKTTQMDILDDYMRQQFGVNSYERVDAGLAVNKKISSVQRFNAKDSECFVFLLDKKACGQAIKLLSVNCVVIFDSDWNPLIDIQALLKVRLSPQLDDLPICRFYSPHSIEERVLISARKNTDLDNNCKSFTLALCQKLLRWGVQKKFQLFDSYAARSNQVKKNEDMPYSREHVKFLLGQLKLGDSEEIGSDNSFWKTALYPRETGQYSKGPALYGETDEELAAEETVSATDFWLEMLKDRQLESQDAQGRELRARKKVQYCEDSFNTSIHTQGPVEDDDELRKKRRRVTDITDSLAVSGVKSGRSILVDKETGVVPPLGPEISAGGHRGQLSQKSLSKTVEDSENIAHLVKAGGSDATQQQNGSEGSLGVKVARERKVGSSETESEPCAGLRTDQQLLLLDMKADLTKLCQALQFQADTSAHVEKLVQSISSLRLPKEKKLLHAVELSLCWLAAEQQHYSIDRHATLSLAESCFGIQIDKVDTVYAKLEEQFKKKFASLEQPNQQFLALRGHDHTPSEREDPNVVENVQASQEVPQGSIQPLADLLTQRQQGSPSVSDGVAAQSCSEERGVTQQQRHFTSEVVGSQHPHHVTELPADSHRGLSDPQQFSPRRIAVMRDKLMNQKRERMQTLLNNQKMQVRKLDRIEKLCKEKLKQEYDRACSRKNWSLTGSDMHAQQKSLYLKNLNIFESSWKCLRDSIVDRQYKEREKENKLMASLLQKINVGQIPGSVPSLESGVDDVNESQIYNAFPAALHSALGFRDSGVGLMGTGSGTRIDAELVAITQGITAVPAAGGSHVELHPTGPGRQDSRASPASISGCISQAMTIQHLPEGSCSDTANALVQTQDNSITPFQRGGRHVDELCHLESHPSPTPMQTSQQLVPSQQLVHERHQHQERHHLQQEHHDHNRASCHQQDNQQPRMLSPSTEPAQAQQVVMSGTEVNHQVQQSQVRPYQSYDQLQSQSQPHFQVQPQPRIQTHLQVQPLQHVQESQAQQTQGVIITHGQQQFHGFQTALSHTNEPGQTSATGLPSVSAIPGTAHQSVETLRGNSGSTNQVVGISPSLLHLTSGAGTTTLSTPPARGSSASECSGSSSVTRILQNTPSRFGQPYHSDPLAQELLRLRKEQDKIKSVHEAERTKIQAQYMKEYEALQKKYESIVHHEDSTYTQKAAALDLNLKMVDRSRRLAEVFRLKNAHDNSSTANGGLNTGVSSAGQDTRLVSGMNYRQTRQQQASSVNTRTPSALQTMLAPQNLIGDQLNLDQGRCILPSISTNVSGMNNSSVFERPLLSATFPSTSAGVFVQFAGVHAGAGSSYSQIHTAAAASSQPAHANSSVALGLCQSRVSLGQSSCCSDSSNLLSSRPPAQVACQQGTQASSRTPSMSSMVFNSSRNHTSASLPAFSTQSIQALNSCNTSSVANVSQYTRGLSERTSTCYVTTYSTAVTSQSGTAILPSSGDGPAAVSVISPLPQMSQGGVYENFTPVGVSVISPLPQMSQGGVYENFTPVGVSVSNSLTYEMSGPSLVNTLESQILENRPPVSVPLAAYSHYNEGTSTTATPGMLTAQARMLSNSLGLQDIFDDSGNIVPAGVICLSDDD